MSPLHVETAGQGRPLVLLHGWAMHAGLFTPLLPALAARHRVVAVDLPGHGHSAALPHWSLAAVVDALEATFAQEGAIDVLGWSLGGLVALAWAHGHPQRVRRLVLVGTSPCFVAYRPTLQRFLALQVQGSDAGKAALAALRHALHARGSPDPSVLSEALRVLGEADLRGEVAAIGAPTLVVAGEHDALVPVAAARWLAATLRHATLVEIAGAAHAPFLSHPDAFVARLSDFLDAP